MPGGRHAPQPEAGDELDRLGQAPGGEGAHPLRTHPGAARQVGEGQALGQADAGGGVGVVKPVEVGPGDVDRHLTALLDEPLVAGALDQGAGVPHVVGVAVGQQDRPQAQAVGAQQGQGAPGRPGARVHHQRGRTGGGGQHVAVGGEDGGGRALEDHGPTLGQLGCAHGYSRVPLRARRRRRQARARPPPHGGQGRRHQARHAHRLRRPHRPDPRRRGHGPAARRRLHGQRRARLRLHPAGGARRAGGRHPLRGPGHHPRPGGGGPALRLLRGGPRPGPGQRGTPGEGGGQRRQARGRAGAYRHHPGPDPGRDPRHGPPGLHPPERQRPGRLPRAGPRRGRRRANGRRPGH